MEEFLRNSLNTNAPVTILFAPGGQPPALRATPFGAKGAQPPALRATPFQKGAKTQHIIRSGGSNVRHCHTNFCLLIELEYKYAAKAPF